MATEASSQQLSVQWGERAAEQCRLPIDLTTMRQQQGYYLQTLTCSAS
ncbi:hypothetical protein [Pseudomonas sp. Teo4]|nr:hypothetical protein [Pseudomonas sp. Teo4]